MALEIGKVAMDIYNNRKTERFQNGESSGPSMINLLGLITMGLAAYLSWTKNTMINPTNTVGNALYAAGAGLFGGILYIIYYFVSMKELVEIVKKCKAAGVAI